MKNKNDRLTSFLEELAFTNTKLSIRKNQSTIFAESPITLKLKLIHNRETTNKSYNTALIELLQSHSNLNSGLKIIYGMNYKDRIDQKQENRKIINSFRNLNFDNQNKKAIAYKNTEYINHLYQLYRLKYK